ncbi:MAG TPA: hypothetical protein VK092_09540 [Deinococcales bacterium]|nr:hypothetical protein [Deinococcales bacterium]
MSDWFSDYVSLTPSTAAGDWGWVTIFWALSAATLIVYQLVLSRRRRRLRKEQSNEP